MIINEVMIACRTGRYVVESAGLQVEAPEDGGQTDRTAVPDLPLRIQSAHRHITQQSC